MSDEISIRKALIYNQAEAMRAIMDRDDRIRDLEEAVSSLNHRLKCRNAEISSLSAAKAYLGHQVALLEVTLDQCRSDFIMANAAVKNQRETVQKWQAEITALRARAAELEEED